MSRVTVTQRLNVLLGVGLVEETLRTLPSGGRPTRVLGIKGSAGFMLVADIGETHIHLAAMNLAPDILAQSTIAFSIAEGPAATLQRIKDEFDKLAAQVRSRPWFSCRRQPQHANPGGFQARAGRWPLRSLRLG